MAMLKIPVSSIPAKGLAVSETFAARTIQPEGVEPLPLEQVELSGEIVPVGGTLLFQAALRGVFHHACDRCLQDAAFPFEVSLVWPFEPGAPTALLESDLLETLSDDEDEDSVAEYTYQSGVIDLGPYIWEELVLAAPVKYICGDNCAGLCPQCGVNLNIGSCACEENRDEAPVAHPGFAGLAQLFNERKPSAPES